MLDHTDRHFRWLARLITRHTLLYTEMVTTGALLHADPERFLAFDEAEHPVALQLGGSDPAELAACARLGAVRGYDEINLNVGCPSDRVQQGRFGACLMAEPRLVADCVRAMRESVDVPVTVKHRIGIDEIDGYDALCDFVGVVAEAGCDAFIVHARKAWLSGLSPKENRTVPPLRHEVVHRLKRDFPQLAVVINGGIESLDTAMAQLAYVDGVMIGRAAYHDPWLLADADERIFGEAPAARTRDGVARDLLRYVEGQVRNGVPALRVTRHALGLYHGSPGARAWRRRLSSGAGLVDDGEGGQTAVDSGTHSAGR
jgi:tRNA-dihydrouridine synthase A